MRGIDMVRGKFFNASVAFVIKCMAANCALNYKGIANGTFDVKNIIPAMGACHVVILVENKYRNRLHSLPPHFECDTS